MGFLTKERCGFSGVAHVEIAIMLFFLLLMVPIEPFSSFIKSFLSTPYSAVMAFLIISGAALLPDADNLEKDGGSTAVYSLGIVGVILSYVMVTISSVITGVCHGKKDVTPYTQHRFFWHTMFVPIVMFIMIYFLCPETGKSLIDYFSDIKGNGIPFAVFIELFLIGISVYLGTAIFMRYLKKIPLLSFSPFLISIGLMAVSVLVGGVVANDIELKRLTYCVALGYTFHLIGDAFADGGIPMLFPISGLWGHFFMRVKLIPVTVTTGSMLENLLKIVFLAIDVVLALFVSGILTKLI